MPGPAGPLFLAGARLRDVVPLAPLVAGVRLSVTALSYDGILSVALLADESISDLPILARGVRSGFDTYLLKPRSRRMGWSSWRWEASAMSPDMEAHANPSSPKVRAAWVLRPFLGRHGKRMVTEKGPRGRSEPPKGRAWSGTKRSKGCGGSNRWRPPCESHTTRAPRRELRSVMDRSKQPQSEPVVSASTCLRCAS